MENYEPPDDEEDEDDRGDGGILWIPLHLCSIAEGRRNLALRETLIWGNNVRSQAGEKSRERGISVVQAERIIQFSDSSRDFAGGAGIWPTSSTGSGTTAATRG